MYVYVLLVILNGPYSGRFDESGILCVCAHACVHMPARAQALANGWYACVRDLQLGPFSIRLACVVCGESGACGGVGGA